MAINGGARPLVDMAPTDNKMEIVIQEILQDKIYLDSEMKVQLRRRRAGGPPANSDLPAKAYERPQSPHRRDRRDRRLQDRRAGQPTGAGRGRGRRRHDALGDGLVGPKTFEALTGRPVGASVFGPGGHPHIEAARAAEVFCIAPATANFLAKAACGLADNLLSTTVLSFAGPIILAPAMNDKMWEKPAVQRNVAQLRADGVVLIDPEEGYLSCGAAAPAAWPRRKNSSTRSPNS